MSETPQDEAKRQFVALLGAGAFLVVVVLATALRPSESPIETARAACEAVPGRVLITAQRGRLACLEGRWVQ